MAMNLLDQMLERYALTSEEQREQALREVMQEIALAGLYRAGFFEKAAFYGGTCLRIFHQLPRFSEDLDFSLLQSDAEFSLQPYFKAMIAEFEAVGLSVEILVKQKSVTSQIESAFLKNTTQVFDLRIHSNFHAAATLRKHESRFANFHSNRQIKIKFEVDTLPPLGFNTEEKLLLQPFSFYVKCFAMPDLFAGKLHALLFRQWKNRVKGRDWYDFEWYVRRGVAPNLTHLLRRASDSGDLQFADLSRTELQALLRQRIEAVDFVAARRDVVRFITDPKALDVWSKSYFLALVEKMA